MPPLAVEDRIVDAQIVQRWLLSGDDDVDEVATLEARPSAMASREFASGGR